MVFRRVNTTQIVRFVVMVGRKQQVLNGINCADLQNNASTDHQFIVTLYIFCISLRNNVWVDLTLNNEKMLLLLFMTKTQKYFKYSIFKLSFEWNVWKYLADVLD